MHPSINALVTAQGTGTSKHLISMASPANQGHLLMLTAVFPDYLNNLAKLLAMLIFSSYLRFVFFYSTNIMTI